MGVLTEDRSKGVFIWDPADLMAFATYARAETHLEAEHVLEGGLTAYDVDGRLLALKVEAGRVTLHSTENDPSHQDELREIIVSFLSDGDDGMADVRELEWDDLVAVAMIEAGLEKRIPKWMPKWLR